MMKNNPKISVVIPVYNNAKYLEECLDSVVNQSFEDIEIIVINDGSADESMEIIQRYAEKNNRIVAVDRENRGVSYSVNEGIKLAKGNYIAFLDSDDYYDLKFLKTVYEAAVEFDLDLTTVNHVNFIKKIGEKNLKLTQCPSTVKENYNKVNIGDKTENLRMFTHRWKTLHKRSLLIDNKIFLNENVTSSSDNGFYFQTIILAGRIMYLDYYGVFHRKDNENSVTKDVDNMFNNFFKEKEFITAKLKERGEWGKYKERVLERFLGNFYFALPTIPF